MADFRTPLARARGLGSAKSGVSHFIAQRVSAIALLVLIPVFIWQVAAHAGAGYPEARAWLASPVGAVVVFATLTAAFYHMRLGLQVVIEDYIHKPGTKIALLVGNTLLTAGLWLVTAYSLLRIAA